MRDMPDRRDMSATRYVPRDTGNADHIARSETIIYRVYTSKHIVRRQPHLVSSLQVVVGDVVPDVPRGKRSEIRVAGEIAMR